MLANRAQLLMEYHKKIDSNYRYMPREKINKMHVNSYIQEKIEVPNKHYEFLFIDVHNLGNYNE